MRVFYLSGKPGKPGHLKEGDVAPTMGKTIRTEAALAAEESVVVKKFRPEKPGNRVEG